MWRSLVKWFQSDIGNGGNSPSNIPTTVKLLDSTESEYFFLELLEGVERGWGQVQVLRVFEALSDRATTAQWVIWLRGFGETLLASPTPNFQLARQMVQLGEIGCGEIGEVARDIGRKLLEREVPNEPTIPAISPPETPEIEEPGVWFVRGIEQFDRGDLLGAIANYDKALEMLPDASEIWYNRANALFNLKPLEEAVSSYDKALELKPNKYEAWNNRGNALLKLGRAEAAVSSYNKALEIQPTYQQAWYNRGVALENLGRTEEAIASYDKALVIQPKDHQAWFNRGLALGNLGRLLEAIASWDKSLELNGDRYEAWYNRGVALSNLGRLDEANASWKKARELKLKSS